jgi:hypothetical protein
MGLRRLAALDDERAKELIVMAARSILVSIRTYDPSHRAGATSSRAWPRQEAPSLRRTQYPVLAYPRPTYLGSVSWQSDITVASGTSPATSSHVVVLKPFLVTNPACRVVVDDRKIGGESDTLDVARGLTTHQLVKHVAAHRFWIARAACVLGQSAHTFEKRAQRRPVPLNPDSAASRTGTLGEF